MDLEQFFGRLEAMYARAAELQLGDAPPPGQVPRWQEATEALQTTMGELRLGEDGKGSEFWAHLLSRRREPRDVSLTVAVARDAQMAPIALRWLVRDISERKRAEDRVHAFNGELERRIRERTAQLEERTAQ